jgi:acetyl-CoA carboxylase biotin carboxyl carrier protein
VNLTAADVAEIIRLVEQSTFDELNLDIDGLKLVLRRAGARVPIASPASSPAAHAPVLASAPDPIASSGGPSAATGPVDPKLRDINAPLLGTFYRAPKPGTPPFVDIGSMVAADSVIAIIEVMKLMNSVRAGVKGVITEILPADEALVEFGQVLMRVREDD